MSWQDRTTNDREVGQIVQRMVNAASYPNTEILVYCKEEDGEWEWSITSDRRFFSLGITYEDEVKRLQEENERYRKALRRISGAKKAELGTRPFGNLKQIAKQALGDEK